VPRVVDATVFLRAAQAVAPGTRSLVGVFPAILFGNAAHLAASVCAARFIHVRAVLRPLAIAARVAFGLGSGSAGVARGIVLRFVPLARAMPFGARLER
jgi:hypothetical protein